MSVRDNRIYAIIYRWIEFGFAWQQFERAGFLIKLRSNQLHGTWIELTMTGVWSLSFEIIHFIFNFWKVFRQYRSLFLNRAKVRQIARRINEMINGFCKYYSGLFCVVSIFTQAPLSKIVSWVELTQWLPLQCRKRHHIKWEKSTTNAFKRNVQIPLKTWTRNDMEYLMRWLE